MEKSVVVWNKSTGDGFVADKAVLSAYVVFENGAFPCSLLHTEFWVQITAKCEMKYGTLKDNKYVTLRIGETAYISFNETVQTKSVSTDMNFTVFRNQCNIIRTDKHMHMRVICGQEVRVSKMRAYKADTLNVFRDNIERTFKSGGRDVEDYRFSKFDYASTVSVRDRKFLPDRTTLESAFGNAETGVLYAYWRHEDKAEPPRRLAGKKRKILHLEEPQLDPDEPE
jgi:hypothetical protein